MGVLEVFDGGTDSGLQLDNADVSLTLLVGRDGLFVGDNLHLEFVVLNHSLDGAEVHPDVVGVEVLELLDRLELVDVLLGDLGNLQQSSAALVINDSTTLDISLGLVRQLHDVLSLGFNHVLQDAEVDHGTQVVGVRQEDDLDASLQELIEDATVVERLEDVTVSGWVPVRQLRVVRFGGWEKRILENTRVSGLVEGEDVNVVAFVLLDNGGGVFVGVEAVHQDKGHIDVVCAVEVFNLSHGEIQEGHAVADLNDGLGTDATHRGTQTTIELDDGELVQELNGVAVGQVIVADDLIGVGRIDLGPVNGVAFGPVIEISSEQSKEVVHFRLKSLLLCGILHRIGDGVQGVAHLAGSHIGGGVLEGLHSRRFHQQTSGRLKSIGVFWRGSPGMVQGGGGLKERHLSLLNHRTAGDKEGGRERERTTGRN